MKTRTMAINTIARIIMAFTELRSEPNMIGMGPMSKTPAPRVCWPVPLALTARSMIATKAKTNPMTTSSNPMFARVAESKLSQPSENRKLREI